MANQVGQEREQWGSKIGFILAAAGSAVGLGNIWKFPYVTGTNGGGAFVLIYVLMVACIGFSVMLAELVIGRRAQLNAVGSFEKIKGGAWPMVGWLGLACGFLILSYYGVVGGWTIKYILHSFTGLMEIAGAGNAGEAFGGFISNPVMVVLYQAIFMFSVIWVVYRGVGEGIERYCKILMPALFILMIILIGRSVTLEGAGAGIEFYLKPDFSKVTAGTVLAALGQAFFSLSLGMGCMITYGSYLQKDISLPGAAAQVCFLDTLVALLAGLVVFPAVFAFGVEPGAGPGLTFITLPGIFSKMPGGMMWSGLFFLLLFVAALTSAISLLEVACSYFIDKGWTRAKAAWTMGTLIFLLGIPSAISLGGGLKIGGKDFIDAAGFMTDQIMMPIGGLLICVFVGWVIKDIAKEELTNNGKLPLFAGFDAWVMFVKFVAPLSILYIFITGLKW
ncbi:sodium-dependent transporter [Dethiosulfovibrio salsuginis]|uniref:Transporter n=1 Tax=Dethiosulfovibrio salsuginis TaxID=561720 RepID=A0A1X7J0K4_9BACT|nr:sodium-dependent transporter [Dethiosulfovibrio salsuginis]SMG21003.1 neurotransmitter:Na+ symporter, NSS family [Dethiosulfovibrio salsuginis]